MPFAALPFAIGWNNWNGISSGEVVPPVTVTFVPNADVIAWSGIPSGEVVPPVTVTFVPTATVITWSGIPSGEVVPPALIFFVPTPTPPPPPPPRRRRGGGGGFIPPTPPPEKCEEPIVDETIFEPLETPDQEVVREFAEGVLDNIGFDREKNRQESEALILYLAMRVRRDKRTGALVVRPECEGDPWIPISEWFRSPSKWGIPINPDDVVSTQDGQDGAAPDAPAVPDASSANAAPGAVPTAALTAAVAPSALAARTAVRTRQQAALAFAAGILVGSAIVLLMNRKQIGKQAKQKPKRRKRKR